MIARGKTMRALRALSPPRVVESTDSPRGCKGRNTDNPDPYDIDVQLFFDHRIRLFYRTNASHDLDSEGIQTHALPNGTEYNQRPDWAGKRGTVVLIGNPNVGHPETQGGGKARGARLPLPWAILWLPLRGEEPGSPTAKAAQRCSRPPRERKIACARPPNRPLDCQSRRVLSRRGHRINHQQSARLTSPISALHAPRVARARRNRGGADTSFEERRSNDQRVRESASCRQTAWCLRRDADSPRRIPRSFSPYLASLREPGLIAWR